MSAVVDADGDRVKLENGTVVPAHHWADWEWLVETDADPSERPAPQVVAGDSEQRTALARVAAWAAVRARSDSELVAKLTAAGLEREAWEGYVAAQAGLPGRS